MINEKESFLRIETNAVAREGGGDGSTSVSMGGEPVQVLMALLVAMKTEQVLAGIILCAADSYRAGKIPDISSSLRFNT